MTSTFHPNRVEKGVPTGGQFAEMAHHEADVSLEASRGTVRDRAVDFVARALHLNAAKSAESRPGQPVRRRSRTKTRMAVAALVLAATVSLTACGTDKGQACQAAPDFGSPTVATASYTAPAAFNASVPLKGGGGGGGHGSGGGHSSSSGHASEGGSTSGHATEGGTSGGSSGSTSGGFHWWPWGSHSTSNQQCTTDAPTSKS